MQETENFVKFGLNMTSFVKQKGNPRQSSSVRNLKESLKRIVFFKTSWKSPWNHCSEEGNEFMRSYSITQNSECLPNMFVIMIVYENWMSKSCCKIWLCFFLSHFLSIFLLSCIYLTPFFILPLPQGKTWNLLFTHNRHQTRICAKGVSKLQRRQS